MFAVYKCRLLFSYTDRKGVVRMTSYYFIAADIVLKEYNDPTEAIYLEATDEVIKGFDWSVQYEIYNGVRKRHELDALLYYIFEQTREQKKCTIQIAHLINSNRVPYKIREKRKVMLPKIKNSSELLLEEGSMLIIEKK